MGLTTMRGVEALVGWLKDKRGLEHLVLKALEGFEGKNSQARTPKANHITILSPLSPKFPRPT